MNIVEIADMVVSAVTIIRGGEIADVVVGD